MTPPETLKSGIFGFIGKTFRGTIVENCQRFRLVGKAYDAMPQEQDGHFEIASARHLLGILLALLDPNVRIIFIIGATQVLKSVVGDIWIPFILEHFLRNILVLFETDQKALLYCDTRLMDTIRQHPVLSQLLGEVDRHDVNKTEIKLAGAKMLVGGLNDSNVSSLSWPVIWVSEAWQHKSDGLLKKAIKRADRFPDTKKILIESQAGEAGEDLHTEARAAHQVPLTWACPYCGGRQTWEFSQTRPSDFVPRPRFDGAGEPPKPGTFAGMAFDSGENLTLDERARSATWECYHCGTRIQDRKDIRQAIMDSYQQDYKITGPDGIKFSPSAVCFTLPKESARDNSFEESAKSYLQAKEAEKSGNLLPLQMWYQAERAVFFDLKLTQQRARVLIGSHNIEGAVPNEIARMMQVDCQQDPDLSEVSGKSVIGHFWVTAYAVDKNARNIYQLARFYATSWKQWIDIRKALKIPNKNVAIDGGHWLDEVVEKAAVNWELGTNYTARGKPFKARTVWTVLRGNGTRSSFNHDDGIFRAFSQPSDYAKKIIIDGTPVLMRVPVVEWSNLSIKNQLFAIRQGGEGKPVWHVLSRDKLDPVTLEKEKGSCTYESQISNEHKGPYKGRVIWIEDNPNVHYNDDDCMCLVQCGRGGLVGHIAVAEEQVNEV